jgi:hypothetical protein
MKDFIIRVLVDYGFFRDRVRDPFLLVIHAQNYLFAEYGKTALSRYHGQYFPEQNEALVILTHARKKCITENRMMIW